MLLEAPQHTLPVSTISSTIVCELTIPQHTHTHTHTRAHIHTHTHTQGGKAYKSAKDTLMRGGYVKTLLIAKESASKKSKKTLQNSSPSASSGGKIPKIHHLKLLKPYRAQDIEVEEKEEGEFGEGEDGRKATPVVFEMPIDMQGYHVIDKRGPQGLNNSVS